MIHFVKNIPINDDVPKNCKEIVFGAGCFWGVERKFWDLPGVFLTSVGYSGGDTENPSYEDVCYRNTNHAEVVKIEFDNKVITYEQILDFFFEIHDPTTLNQQGPDRGSQYRSLIGYYDETQCEIAKQITDKLNESQFNQKIASKLWTSTLYSNKKLSLTYERLFYRS